MEEKIANVKYTFEQLDESQDGPVGRNETHADLAACVEWYTKYDRNMNAEHAGFACIIFANLVYACVNSNITAYCLLQKADEPTRKNVFVFHQNYTVILVTAIRNVDWFTVENLI